MSKCECKELVRYVHQLFGGAADPNSLIGPTGAGAQRWVSEAQALPYAVSFGNEPTATAPAQQVSVTQALDKNLDVTTLSLAGAMIPNGSGGSIQVPVSPGVFNPAIGLNEFKTVVDLRPVKNLLVDMINSLHG